MGLWWNFFQPLCFNSGPQCPHQISSKSVVGQFSMEVRTTSLLSKNEILNEQKREFNFNNLPKKCIIEKDFIVKIKNNFHKILIPENLRNKLIKKFHNDFGHIGVKKMLT